jgi:hypothetical protein
MTRKKRKYTRRKKPWKINLLKKITIYWLIVVFLHILFINAQIIFSSPKKSEVIVILGNENQNSQRLTKNHQIKINKSIELFQNNFAKKILILWEENNFWIDWSKLITEYLMKNEVWWGSIATENSDIKHIWKNSSLFLKENEWSSLINVSNFWEVWKMKYHFWTSINQNNISIQPVYSGILDSIFWIFTNYYYFWKI